ncbi:MAG TPA: phytanoyl-CoA dioxygenase family protein [Micropepsaceae bacterium]|nr:phytanoyl-CoA dioxygenase family protein [Micropepsaceae bacterium]
MAGAAQREQRNVAEREHYLSEGYCVFKKLVPDALIDRVLSAYRADILPSKAHFFRQSTHRWARNRISASGYAIDSFLDVHDYPDHPAFSEAVRYVVCAPQMRSALAELTGAAEHRLMQSMLFDLNTATFPHQDWYYLDSLPNGHLLAAWVAMEDIKEAAGRFYVVPKSHRLELDPANSVTYGPYIELVKHYFAEHSAEAVAPELKKGDVLFWNSRTLHGSLPTRDPSFSRKSLTAHYLPGSYEFGSRNAARPIAVRYRSHDGMRFREPDSRHRRYSLWAKVRTDVFASMHERPPLRNLAVKIAQSLKH